VYHKMMVDENDFSAEAVETVFGKDGLIAVANDADAIARAGRDTAYRHRSILYISGPTEGITENNIPRFDLAATILRAMGFRVINPFDFGFPASMSGQTFLKRNLNLMGMADFIVQLPGWDYCRMASLEYDVATRTGLGIRSFASMAGKTENS
jgi:Domain of unknown function (DUF4406)